MTSGEDVPLIADLLSTPDRRSLSAAQSHPAEAQGEDASRAVAQVEGLAAHQPVLMVFEDVHWIDPTHARLLDLLIERVPSAAGPADHHLPPGVPAALDRPAAGDAAHSQPSVAPRNAPR